MGISLEKSENVKDRNIWSFLSIRLFFFVLAIFFLLSLADCTRNTHSENISGLDKTFTEDTISTSNDQASGNITEKEKLNVKKIHPELSEFLNDKYPEDLVKINIWIHADYESAIHDVADKYPEANLIGDRPSDKTDPELYEKIREEMYEVRSQVIRVAAEPIEAFIVSKGGTITYTSYVSPIIFAQISKNTIFELSLRNDVSTIYLESSELQSQAPHLPLEGIVNFNIQESKGDFSLYLYTEKDYGYSTAIEASLSADDPKSLNVEIKYIYNPNYPYSLAMSGSAGLTLDLGRLEGEYELAFSYNGTVDRYRALFAPEKISVGSDTASFTSPIHIEWLRLSPDVIWFNTFSLEPSVIRTEDYVYLGKEDYQDYVNNFFAEIEVLGAQRFLPGEGHYPYSGFIPPWPDRFIFKGDYTEVPNPDTPDVIWSEKWMDLRYYRFSGNIEEIIDLIDTNYELFSTQLYIALYDTEKQLYPYK